MIAADLRSAALAIEIAAQRPEAPEWLRQHLPRAIATLDDCAARVALIERQRVPPHWLPQKAEPADLAGNVVSMRGRAC